MGPSCIPPVYPVDPLSALLMNIFAFTHQKTKKKNEKKFEILDMKM